MANKKDKALTTTEDKSLINAKAERAIQEIEDNIQLSSISVFDLRQARISAGGSTLWANGEEEIEGIILQTNSRRTYWSNPDPTGQAPECSSEDLIHGIGIPGGECLHCPYAQYKSADKGNGQACKEWRFVYVLEPAGLDALMHGGVTLPTLLRIPPSSIVPYQQYLVRQIITAALQPAGLVSAFRLIGTKNADGIPYAEIQPRIARHLTDEELSMTYRFKDRVLRRLIPAHERLATLEAGDVLMGAQVISPDGEVKGETTARVSANTLEA